MEYPITITEYPHQGAPRTWTLWDQAHLMRCIDAARGKFEDWVQREGGAAVFEIDEEGTATIKTLEGDAIYCPEVYIDFLRRDLKKIEAKEVE